MIARRLQAARPRGAAWIVLAIAAAALALRLYGLDVRAMHHDESLHAQFAWRFAEGQGYVHDPLMHGPLLFHTLAAVFKAVGEGDAVSRLPFAVAGSALVLTPLLLRRRLGDAGVVAAALLLALSPVLLYYSRFARNDLPAALWTVLLFASIWRYREDGRERWLALATAALALSFATKETAYLVAAAALLYLNAAFTASLLARFPLRGADRLRVAIALFPAAWLLAALWRPLGPLRRRFGLGMLPREGDLLVVTGTLTAPFLAAALQLPFPAFGAPDGPRIAGELALAAIAASAGVGVLWNPRRWPPLGVLAALIVLPLFTTWFTNADGFVSGFWGQLDYWLAQQDVQRGHQPGFYYLMMLPIYEFLALIPALVGGAWLLWRGNRLARLLAWWFLAMLAALSLAGEKMPWLNVHLAVPLALLAGLALGEGLPAAARRLRGERATARGWSAAGAVVAAGALLAGLSLRTAADVSFSHPDTPVEPLIYTQTAPDVPALAREIERVARARGAPVIVDTTASMTWPWAWYLRDLPDVRYLPAAEVRGAEAPEGAVLVSAAATLAPDWPQGDRFGPPRPFVHRWWFEEGGYKGSSFGSLLRGLRSGDLLADWASFVAGRTGVESLGALRGEVRFPRGAGP